MIKLLARGDNPFLVAEVGTGKTTMGLYVAAALSPEHRPRTVAELDRLGLPTDQLPTVRRTLVLCPPHLIKSWTDQVAAVLPEARVKVLRRPSDLDADADVYLLSRESAKLGLLPRHRPPPPPRRRGTRPRRPGPASRRGPRNPPRQRHLDRARAVRRAPLPGRPQAPPPSGKPGSTATSSPPKPRS